MEVDISPSVSLFNEFFTTAYRNKINQLANRYPEQASLFVDYTELEKMDPGIADALIHTPDLMIEAAEEAVRQMNISVAAGVKFAPHVRFVNLPSDDKLIEQLNSRNINEMVAFKAVVTKRAEIMNRVKIALYKCELCETEFKLLVVKNFTPPKRCENCKKFGTLKQSEEESTYVDIQKAEVQELLERVRGGAPAAHIEILLEEDMVNQIAPGDNTEIVGILRLKPPQKMKQKQDFIYSRYIEINSIRNLKKDFEEIEITKEEERRLVELSQNPRIADMIVDSIAPSIYGHNEVKRALTLQLFGGTRGKTMKGGMPIRDDIHVLLIGDPGIAKCTDGESRVVLADGSVRKIRDIVEEVMESNKIENVEDGAYSVSNHDIVSLGLSGRTEHSKATYFWKLKVPDHLFEIETNTGRRITVTPKHPFFVPSDGFIRSKPANELQKGEFIATPRFIGIKGAPQKLPKPKAGKTNANRTRLPDSLDADFARLLGYIAGDGYVRRTSSYEINFTNCDEDLLQDFSTIINRLGIGHATSRLKQGSTKTKTISAFSVELGRVLEDLGMVRDSFAKTVPDAVLRSPNRIAKEFIKAYFDCEASVGKEGITVVSASRELLDLVQILLMRFGIIGQIHVTMSRATNAKNHSLTKYHRLFVLGENAFRYGNSISFTSREKRKKLAKLGKKFNTNIDVVPGLNILLAKTRESLGISQFHCGVPRSTYQHYERGNRNPPYDSLRCVLDAFRKSYVSQIIFGDERLAEAAASISVLETLSKSHIFWDKVKSIRSVKPKEKWVYDLQADSTHNFIANGMFVHNSRFLQSVSEIAPKSIYVSGKSVSGVGLTVAAERDELGDGGWTLKAGALVLASGGTAQIDEFDKIEEEDRAALHEAMETQTISVAKAGMVAKFRTKTAILAAANPKYGRFDQTKNLGDQFDIPPTLLSRFDLIFAIVDVLDEEKDAKLATHILNTHMGLDRDGDTGVSETLDKDLLRKYIAFARRKVSPKLTKEASEKIKEYYVDLRRKSKDAGSVAITPRYLEGLVRLAEANAKIRLNDIVEGTDADAAVALFTYVMQQIMTDKATGLFDVDVVTTGKPKSERDKLQKADTVLDIIREHLRKNDTADIEEVVADSKSYDLDETTVRRIISELLRKGVIYEKEYGHIRIVGEK